MKAIRDDDLSDTISLVLQRYTTPGDQNMATTLTELHGALFSALRRHPAVQDSAVSNDHMMQNLRTIGANLKDENLSSGGKTHNWRRYISTPVALVWREMSDDARGAAYMVAEDIASQEEWD